MEQKLNSGYVQQSHSPIILFPFSSKSLIKTTEYSERLLGQEGLRVQQSKTGCARAQSLRLESMGPKPTVQRHIYVQKSTFH